MNKNYILPALLILIFIYGFIIKAYAGTSVWTFTPITATHITISNNDTTTIQYTVTNQSGRPHTLIMTPIAGIQSNVCSIGGHQSCVATLTITGSLLNGNVNGGPIFCDQGNPNQCYQPSAANSLAITKTQPSTSAILSSSISSSSALALSVNCPVSGGSCVFANAALTGNPRIITMTNTGSAQATGMTIDSAGLPTGSSYTTTCGSTLAAGASCTITVTPGQVATSGAGSVSCDNGIAPISGTITVNAANATSVANNINVLTYGCIYQQGYLYAVDDTTPISGSIGGTVVSLTDQVSPGSGIDWSSNGASGTASFDLLPGIDTISTSSSGSPVYSDFSGMFDYPSVVGATYTNPAPNPPIAFSACDGNVNGLCNSTNILLFYNQYVTNYSNICDGREGGPGCLATARIATNHNYYAAGICNEYAASDGVHNWYLPAICELDNNSSAGADCTNTQSILNTLSSLVGTTSIDCTFGANCLAGIYWSSTEDKFNPRTTAWIEIFSGGGSLQTSISKSANSGLRCTRALT